MAAAAILVSGLAQHLKRFSSLCLHRKYGMINDAFPHCTGKKHKRIGVVLLFLLILFILMN